MSLAVLLAGIWSLTYYCGVLLRKDMVRMLGEQQFSTASLLASNINRELELRLLALKNTADGITQSTFDDPVVLQRLLDSRLNLKPLFSGGYFAISVDGIGRADVPRSTGRVGMSVADRGWMQEALTGKVTIGKPVRGKRLQVPVFTMATPIRNREGAVIGVLAGVVNLSQSNFLTEITDSRYAKMGDYFLVSRQHRLVVLSSKKRYIMEPLPPRGANPGIDRNIDGFEGYMVSLTPSGREHLVAAKGIPAAGWYLAVSVPTSDAFAPAYDLQRRMVLAALFLSLLVGALTWRLMGRQLAPMVTAAKELGRLSDPDQAVVPLPVARDDEVGRLIGAFNAMLAAVATREATLKLSEQALKRNHEMLLAILNGLDALVYVADMQTYELLFVNDCMRSRFGDIDGLLCWQHIQSGQSGPCSFCSNDKLLDSDGNPAGIYRWEIQNTLDQRWYDVRDRAIPWVDGRLVRLEIATDITERKEAEADKLALEKQLYRAQKMESLGVLTGGVAHDFNNILMIIMGHCSVARMKPAAVSDSLGQIERAAERAAELCRQMLAYAGKSSVVREQADLRSLVHDMVQMLRATVGRNVIVTEVLAEGLPPLLADSSQLRQVVLGVVVNATEAIGGAQGEVRVSLLQRELRDLEERDYQGTPIPAGSYACLEVTDNGCGMTAEESSRIFEPFFTTKFAGRGLGMSAVQGIVTAENGAIQLCSRKGEGTTVTIYLPLPPAAVAIGEGEAAPEKKEVPAGKGAILVVEDEEQVLEVASSMLAALGFEVIVARNGKEALERYRESAGSVSLVFTDLGMPVMDGYQLLKSLKELAPNLPVVVSSGFGDIDIASHVPDGVVATVSKPYTFTEIREVMERVVKPQAA